MNKRLVMVGAGGHARVLRHLLESQGVGLSAVVSKQRPDGKSRFGGLDWYASDEEFISKNSPKEYLVINGLGSIPGNGVSRKVFDLYSASKFKFHSIIAPSAILCTDLMLGIGVHIMAGVVIQPGVKIGDNSVVNTGAIIDHDCKIGNHNHIAPGAVLSGGVVTGDGVHVGTGASIIQGVSVGHDAVVGAGLSLVRNLSEGEVVIPAAVRFMRQTS